MSLRHTLVKLGTDSISHLTVSPVIPGHQVFIPTLSIQGMSFSSYLCYSESTSSLFSSVGHVLFSQLRLPFRHGEFTSQLNRLLTSALTGVLFIAGAAPGRPETPVFFDVLSSVSPSHLANHLS